MGGWPAFLLAAVTAAHNFTDETQPQQNNVEKLRNVSPPNEDQFATSESRTRPRSGPIRLSLRDL
jgi:hypothetical protein